MNPLRKVKQNRMLSFQHQDWRSFLSIMEDEDYYIKEIEEK